MTFTTSYGIDEVTRTVPLQKRFGQGIDGAPIGSPGEDVCGANCPFSWGAELDSSTPVYDHADELFDTGSRFENFLSWSGGSEATTYYLSLGRLDHAGSIDGNQSYERTTVRLKGGHAFTDNLRLSASFAYTDSDQLMVQQGSNISGLMLGALRSPPEFDNREYLTETGLHRSYQNPNPTTLTEARGFDNPFWTVNEMPNTSDVGRTVGNVSVDYDPVHWLSFSYVLGADYYADERVSTFPKSSSDFPTGRIIRADFIGLQVDHNLLATLSRQFSPDFAGTLTLGQNLNHQEFSQFQVNGQTLIHGTDQTDFTVDRIADEYEYTIRTDGHFAQAGLDLYDQLFLTGALRLDGSSTFGGDAKRFWYPKASLAWRHLLAVHAGER